MSRWITAAVVGVVLAALPLGALAQGGAPAPSTPPHRPGMLGRMLHRGQASGMHHPMAHMGAIIGNKKTHVYHLPGTGGNLPAEKNRVYFRTEAEARAAGYHAAGQGGPHGHMATMPLHGRHPMYHPMHHMGGTMPPRH